MCRSNSTIYRFLRCKSRQLHRLHVQFVVVLIAHFDFLLVTECLGPSESKLFDFWALTLTFIIYKYKYSISLVWVSGHLKKFHRPTVFNVIQVPRQYNKSSNYVLYVLMKSKFNKFNQS